MPESIYKQKKNEIFKPIFILTLYKCGFVYCSQEIQMAQYEYFNSSNIDAMILTATQNA